MASIRNQAKSFQVFQERPSALSSLNRGSQPFLRERAAIHESSFQVHGFGASVFTADQDVIYNVRDYSIDTERELQTCQTARLVNDWSNNLTICRRLILKIESWAELLVRAVDLTLGFDLKWLKKPAEFLSHYWCTLCDLLSQSVAERDKYRVMILLSTLSYSPHTKQELVLTLLTFATSPEL